MAKSKEKEYEAEKKFLSPAQYWQWNCNRLEVELAREKLINADSEQKLLKKDSEIAALKGQISSTKIQTMRNKYDSAISECKNYTSQLESELGIELKDKLIKENYEIVNAPSNSKEG